MAAGRVGVVFDENFSHHHVKFVSRESGLPGIVHTRQMSWSGKQDKIWIPFAVNAGFVIVSADRNDKTREYTVNDLKLLGARVILVDSFWDHWGRWEKAQWLVGAIEVIHATAIGMTTGSVKLLTNKRCRFRDL